LPLRCRTSRKLGCAAPLWPTRNKGQHVCVGHTIKANTQPLPRHTLAAWALGRSGAKLRPQADQNWSDWSDWSNWSGRETGQTDRRDPRRSLPHPGPWAVGTPSFGDPTSGRVCPPYHCVLTTPFFYRIRPRIFDRTGPQSDGCSVAVEPRPATRSPRHILDRNRQGT
jgi:hypothetical protein